MSHTQLYTGNKCFSSWSLRPWLALKMAGVEFEDITIRLRQPDTSENIFKVSPNGKVPLLVHEGRKIWESYAILEYIAETFPQAKLWPERKDAKAWCRSIAVEMHGGFMELRSQWGMNLRRVPAPKPLEGKAIEQFHYLQAIWEKALYVHHDDGPFLFGHFTIADAMYAPVVSRFHSYAADLTAPCAEYCAMMIQLPAMKEWYGLAAQETWPEPDPAE